MKTKMTFQQWMMEVDDILVRKCGAESLDLPDMCYADWYDDDIPPYKAAHKVLMVAGF